LNPGRRGGKPATNRLSYGAASLYIKEKGYILWASSITLTKIGLVVSETKHKDKTTDGLLPSGFICLKIVLTMFGKSSIFWEITQYSPFKVDRRFGGTCRDLFFSILHRMPTNQAQDLSSIFLGSLPTTTYHFAPVFFPDQHKQPS
jgi:hypothetical protein